MNPSDPLPVVSLTLHLFDEPALAPAEQEHRWNLCYGPLFAALDRLPRLRFGLVLGGELLSRWENEAPERLETVRRWSAEQRVELLATALWEPVLSAVPERDAIAQIVAHALLVKRLFGVRPRGCWLPYRQWDPALPRVFERAEIDWVLVDDLAILRHHPGRPDPWGVWWTERGGHAVRMFATDARAVEMAADVPVRDLLLYARGRAVQGAVVQFWALRAPDFGLAERRDALTDAAWLADFLTGLAGAEHLRTETPSVAGGCAPERGRTYLPSCAPPDRDHPWERHLLIHAEADRLHKKMLRVSRQLARWGNDVLKGEARPDPDGQLQAERYLLRAQGAEVYLPGDDPARRWRAWRDLVRAERQVLRCRGSSDRAVAELADLSTSGRTRVLLRTESGCCVVDPREGAGLSELSFYDLPANVVDPWRSREPDGDPGRCFVESFAIDLHGDVEPPTWTLQTLDRDEDGTARCAFQGEVASGPSAEPPLALVKTYILRAQPRLDWVLDLHNPGTRPVRGRVTLRLLLQPGPDLEGLDLRTPSLGWPGAEAHKTLGEVAEVEIGVMATMIGAPRAALDAPTGGLQLGLRRPAKLTTAPVRSAGPEGRVYDQGLSMTLEWTFELVGGERDRLGTSLEVAL